MSINVKTSLYTAVIVAVMAPLWFAGWKLERWLNWKFDYSERAKEDRLKAIATTTNHVLQPDTVGVWPDRNFIRTNPPPGDVILCDGEGHFLPLVEGKHKFIFEPVSTNYADAVKRLWIIYNLTPAKRDAQKQTSPDQFNWKKCDE